MVNMEKWKAHYKDENHDIETYIENHVDEDYYCLRMIIDDIEFECSDFYEWEIINEEYLEKANEKFNILKWGFKDCYTYNLQRYYLEVEIPINVIEIESGNNISAIIHFAFQLTENTQDFTGYYLDRQKIYSDGLQCIFFKLELNDEVFESTDDNFYLEINLSQICEKIRGKYLLKCCFGCLYSDYSPFGNSSFGDMLCFSNFAEKYMKVKGKDDALWEILNDGKKTQETHLCEKFKPRINFEGYRGSIY